MQCNKNRALTLRTRETWESSELGVRAAGAAACGAPGPPTGEPAPAPLPSLPAALVAEAAAATARDVDGRARPPCCAPGAVAEALPPLLEGGRASWRPLRVSSIWREGPGIRVGLGFCAKTHRPLWEKGWVRVGA